MRDTARWVMRSEWPAAADVSVRRCRGREALGRLFRYDVWFETRPGARLGRDELDALVGSALALADELSDAVVAAGIVTEVERCLGSGGVGQRYRARVAPRLWRAGRSRRSRVFQDSSLREIAAQVAAESGLAADRDADVRLRAAHPPRRYTVQYQESDLALLCRLCEYEGAFFFFEHGAADRVVLVDDNGALPEPVELPFRPAAGALVTAPGVQAFAGTRRIVEGRVELRDYNYRTPAVELAASATVDAHGWGARERYGEHFKDPADGARLALLRAEERAARRDTFSGALDVAGLHAGSRFALDGGDPELEGEYLITAMRHELAQSGAPAADGAEGYRARFTAIPAAVPFRPPRRTAWPRIHGLMHARVDGSQTTSLDAHGRYKILLPFDRAVLGTGRASRWIRMAQPLGGRRGKMHFPLEVGTEVLLAHIDGDPDRPIIVGAVPNHETPSPVVQRNALQSVIATRSGIRMVFDDDPLPTNGG